MAGDFRQLVRNMRKLNDAQMALGMLANRLRDGGPEMSREEIRERLKVAIDKLNEFSKLTCEVFQKSMECVFSGDIKMASTALEMKNILDEEEEKLLMSKLPSHYGSVNLGLARIAENSATIAATAINKALEKPNKLCKPYPQGVVT